jgi:hypothetical protein
MPMRIVKTWLQVVVMVTTLLPATWVAAAPRERPDPGVSAPAVETKLYLPFVTRNSARGAGAFIPLVDNNTWAATTDAFLALTGQPHTLYLISSGYDCSWAKRINQIKFQLNHIHALRGVPLITWMPQNCTNGGFGDVNSLGLPDILSGAWDEYIVEWARAVGALGYPVFVRWGHEMNIPSYSWAGQHAFGLDGRSEYTAAGACGLAGCYGDPNVADGPERYIAAYRRVHDLADPLAPNILWVWNPNSRDYPLAGDAPWNQYNNYYPGDDYVDWVGLDGYNWGDGSGNGYGYWVGFNELFAPQLTDLQQRYPDKLQMIPEIASVEDPSDPNRKANFIRDAFQASFSFQNLRYIIWVHDDTFVDAFRTPPAVADFRVNSSPETLAAYQQAIAAWAANTPLP